MVAGGARLAIAQGWFRPPFPPLGKRAAWALGTPEEAYGFGVVTAGRVYRSARPDARLLRRLRDRYGVRRVVNLAGAAPSDDEARALGLEVESFGWRVGEMPPAEELEAVLERLAGDEPVLVHCAAGSDRTGLAVAAYRVRHDAWPLDRAVEEMQRHWHRPDRHLRLHRALRAWLAETGT